MGRAWRKTIGGKRFVVRDLPVIGDALARREWNVFWYENPGWERHTVAKSPDLSVGGSLGDIDGDGMEELIVGQNDGNELYWFDPPKDPREPWDRYQITDGFQKYHDTAVSDIDDDGFVEVIVLSQRSEVVGYFDVPGDPRASPWPADHFHEIATGLNVEGVAVGDLDGDGKTELVAGPNVFSRNGTGWSRRSLGAWEWTRLALADLDGDGVDEIIMSEGDLPYQGDRNGRLGVVDTNSWTVDLLDDDLYCPHTLQVGDLTGSGSPDILVGEMGLDRNPSPHVYVYRNDGTGNFDRLTIASGVATHEGKVVDLNGNGRLDLVSKAYGPSVHVDVWMHHA